MKVPKKPVQRVKHVPQRTCVGCREVLPKRRDGSYREYCRWRADRPNWQTAGRGAYLHDRRECWERGLKGALAHALKTYLTQDDRARLSNL